MLYYSNVSFSPNIPLSELQIRLSGKDIIDLFYN